MKGVVVMPMLIVMFCLGAAPVIAGGQEVARGTVVAPDSVRRSRAFDMEKWKAVVGDRDYTERKRETGFQIPSMPWAGPLFKIISYVLIIGLVLWILYYLVTNIGFRAGIERTAMVDQDVTGRIESIENIDVEALLAQARREGNYRLAIRLYYLGMLKKLHALGVIAWKKEKTNRDYLTELRANDFHYGDMQRLTLLYEAVWYGEHTLASESFERLTGRFEAMYEKINSLKVS